MLFHAGQLNKSLESCTSCKQMWLPLNQANVGLVAIELHKQATSSGRAIQKTRAKMVQRLAWTEGENWTWLTDNGSNIFKASQNSQHTPFSTCHNENWLMTSKPSLVGHTRIRRDVYLPRSHLLQQMLTPHCESVTLTMVPCCRNVRTTADQISGRFTHHHRQGSRAQRPAVLTANRPAEMAEMARNANLTTANASAPYPRSPIDD